MSKITKEFDIILTLTSKRDLSEIGEIVAKDTGLDNKLFPDVEVSLPYHKHNLFHDPHFVSGTEEEIAACVKQLEKLALESFKNTEITISKVTYKEKENNG